MHADDAADVQLVIGLDVVMPHDLAVERNNRSTQNRRTRHERQHTDRVEGITQIVRRAVRTELAADELVRGINLADRKRPAVIPLFVLARVELVLA